MKNLQKFSMILILLLVTTLQIHAATFTSRQSGKWENPCTWYASCVGSLPGPGDDVIINADIVTVDAATKTAYGGTITVKTIEVKASGTGTLIVSGTGVRLNIYQGSTANKCNFLLSDNASKVDIRNNAFIDVQGGLCIKTCSSGANAISTTGGGNIRVGGCVDCGAGYTSPSSTLNGCTGQNSFGAGLNFCVTCNISGCPSFQSTAGSGGCQEIILLPVTFVNVSAIYQQKTTSVAVNWATSIEVNNAKFEVQRSLDGLNYYTIGAITPQMANSTSTLYYEYIDKTLPKANAIYYRIKQTDIDGQYSYSKLVVAQRTNKIAYSNIYPNPSDNGNIFIHIEGDESAKMLVSYTTLQGKLLFREELSGVNGTTKFNSKENLSTGIYLVCIETENNVFYHKLQVVR